MDKPILDLIADFKSWKGDTYRLASLITEKQKELDREVLVLAGFVEAAELI